MNFLTTKKALVDKGGQLKATNPVPTFFPEVIQLLAGFVGTACRRIWGGVPTSIRSRLLMVDPEPRLVADFPERRVLVLAPHIDDEVLGCGGAILLHLSHEADVTVAYITDGRRGHAPFPGEWSAEEIREAEDELVRRRQHEAKLAADTLGTIRTVFLDQPDGRLRVTPSGVDRLTQLFHDVVPDVVYLPSLLDDHIDHWQTNGLFNAVLPRISRRLPADTKCRGYEVWTPVPANRFVDITGFMDRKIEAIKKFQSQLADTDLVRTSVALNTYRSLRFQHGRGYAEAFFECSVKEYRFLFREIEARTPVQSRFER